MNALFSLAAFFVFYRLKIVSFILQNSGRDVDSLSLVFALLFSYNLAFTARILLLRNPRSLLAVDRNRILLVKINGIQVGDF